MTYRDAAEFLCGLRLFGAKFGLENSFALARLCGQPHEHLCFIHVAGTNGKGSVCAMLESIYRQAGLRTGLFTSPHLVSLAERFQVSRVCIPESDVTRLTSGLMDRLGGRDPDRWPFRPTFFEFVTAMALLYFREQQCDLVLWETGMGGRLDATNIVTPLASVITNVQLDHQQWLGETPEAIAREKAGIIKAGIPVITAAEGPALEVIRAVAAERSSPLRVVSEPLSSPAPLALAGGHQRINAAVAAATVETLQNTIPVPPETLARGLASAAWPGRLQSLEVDGATVVLDGAHNPHAARALAQALARDFASREVTLVLGVFADKAWREMCDLLIPAAARVFLVPIQSERSANPREIAAYCAARWPRTPVTLTASSEAGVRAALAFPFVVVTGSLHLVGEVMETLGMAPGQPSERQFNEWNAAKRR